MDAGLSPQGAWRRFHVSGDWGGGGIEHEIEVWMPACVTVLVL